MSIYQPVAGCSEIINQRIVSENQLLEYAQSCLRSDKPGIPCGGCWKCFRKNTLAGHEFRFTNEIDKFLEKRPLKQAVSTLYSIQTLEGGPFYSEVIGKSKDLEKLIKGDYSFLEFHHGGSLNDAEKYRRYTESPIVVLEQWVKRKPKH